MKVLAPFTLLAAAVAARDVLVIAPNPGCSTPSIDATTARHVLEQRLGLSQRISNVDEATIDALNTYGGSTQKLFGQDEERPSLLLIIDNILEPKDMPSAASLANFTISNPPSKANNLALIKYFNSRSRIGEQTDVNDIMTVEDLLVPFDGAADMYKTKQSTYHVYLDMQASTPEKVNDLVASTLELAEDWDLTVALMPATTQSQGLFSKRSAQSSWFSDLPSSGRPDVAPASNHDTNVANPPHSPSFPEDVYVSQPSQSSASEPSSSWLDSLYPFNSEDEASTDSTPAWKAPTTEITRILASNSSSNSTSAPKGILPACYSSQSACESSTHNCAGHGSCSLKYKDSMGPGKGACYSCQCSVSRHTNKDGTVKTTRWTGPACQKKDVSFEFWLLGSVTVGLVSVIAWGVGLLMRMGAEDLPSVIGAGVAGVSRKN